MKFKPCNFFALGSPIAMFLTVRGVDCLGEAFHLPTCPGFFNIFHPFDPVAYRIEPMVIRNSPVKPVLMPHHKGRKRLHLELRESLSRVGSDLKQRIIDSVKSTWKTINDLARYRRDTGDDASVSASDIDNIVSETVSNLDDANSLTTVSQLPLDEDYPVGRLNRGHRVDYVLQEKPIESFNDYLFALSSHACYWESEDTVLMILKEIYSVMGVTAQKSSTDTESAHQPPSLPAHGLPPSMPFRPPALGPHFTNGSSNSGNVPIFAAPPQLPNSGIGGPALATAPGTTYLDYSPHAAAISASPSSAVGPPPKSGFVRK